MHNARTSAKWNLTNINMIKYESAFPNMASQNVCCEKQILSSKTLLTWITLPKVNIMSLDPISSVLLCTCHVDQCGVAIKEDMNGVLGLG